MIDKIYNTVLSFSPKHKQFIPNYHNILYLLGYGWKHKPIYIDNDFEEASGDNIKITVETDIKNNINGDVTGINITEKITSRRSSLCLVNNVIYNVVILLLISWPFIYSIVLSIINANLKFVTENIFQFLFIVQYITGSIYFNNKHLYNILRSKVRKPFTYTIWMYTGFIVSVILSIIVLVLYTLNIKISAYSEINSINIWVKILVCTLLFLEKLFSYTSFFTNMITFLYIMVHHKGTIENLNKKLCDLRSNDFSNNISTVSEEFFRMRQEYGKTIKNLNYIFSTLNIVGLVAFYFALKNVKGKTYIIMELINVCIFVIIELLYILSINKVKINIDKIKEEMTSINYVSQILSKSKDYLIVKNSTGDTLHEISYHSKLSAITSVKSADTLEWIIMKEILNVEWDTFKFLGFSITDSYIIQKIFGFMITILIAKDISDGISL